MTTMESIEPVLERLLAGEALPADQREALAGSRDLLAIGMAADEIRRRLHGSRVTYLRVAHVAVADAARGAAGWQGRPGEVRLDGVASSLEEAVSATAAAVAEAGGIPVAGFSLADIEQLARGEVAAWCRRLAEAGLGALSEAPLDRLEAPESALDAALGAGLPVAALTVDRTPPDVLAVIDRAAALAARFPAIDVFAPLARRTSGVTPTTGFDDVRLVALARLLSPLPHIQVDWQRYGPKLAQVALTFGADDVDDVSAVDEVAEGRRRSPLEEIRRNIEAAGAEPAERASRAASR